MSDLTSILERLLSVAGEDFRNRDCRVTNPRITARESIVIADYIVALQNERDQLAAQVEQLREFAALIVEWKEYGFEKAKTLLDSTPEQYLAEIKAQAVEDFIDSFRAELGNFDAVDHYGWEYANQLRKAAKAGE